jgi:hypothetical protein
MKRRLGAFAVLLIASTATQAQFTITPGGTQNSVGELFDPGNSVVNSTYTGPNALFGTMTFSGTLTSVFPGTWPADSELDLWNTTRGGFVGYLPSTQTGTFTSVDIARTHNGLFWFNQNDQLRVETYENFDDGDGTDAQWTNLNLTFNNSVSTTFLGNFNEGSSFNFDTNGSNYDTEIALFSNDGVLLAENDDIDFANGNLQSQINVGQLAVGDYYLVIGGFNSLFADGFAIGGSDFGNYVLNLNGNSIFGGASSADQLARFSFSVFAPVPEPTTFALVAAVGGIAFASRRFRRTVA